MIDNKSVDINIPNNQEKGKGTIVAQFFLPALILLIGISGYGGYKLMHIEKSKVPISIEYTATTTKPTLASLADLHVSLDTSSSSISQISPQATSSKIQMGKYVASRGGSTYYLPTCSGAKRLSDKNKIWFDTKEEAQKFGYKPAKNCPGI